MHRNANFDVSYFFANVGVFMYVDMLEVATKQSRTI